MLRTAASLLATALAFAAAPLAARAVESADFVFDTTTDPGDLPDGPDFVVTGVGPIDDTGTGCDAVAMVIVDAFGTPVDVDSFCLSIPGGTGGSDGDYGSFGTGALPAAGPATYALFDLTAEDLAALSGFGDADQEYFDYVVANSRLLVEKPFDVPGLESGTPFSLQTGMQCYQAKDRTSPRIPASQDVAVSDAFATGTVDVQKLAYYCVGTGANAGDPALCCYKTKGTKLAPAPILETGDTFGERSVEVKAPKLLCKICNRSALPLP
jgi:hypothetical protein